MCKSVKLPEMHNKLITPIWIIFISVLSQGMSDKANFEVTCGHADKLFEKCFSNSDISNASRIFVKQQRGKIPYSFNEINDYCRVFDRGLFCYNEYVEKCMDAMSKRLLNGEVGPAKNFYLMLCKDEHFKKDYLSHRECFRHIELDFDECTKHYQSVLDSEFTRIERERKSNINVQYMHFCCARYSYENCVFNSARAKCNMRSAMFTKSIVELLSSERHFKNCDKIEKPLCSSGIHSLLAASSILIAFAIKVL